MQNDYPIPGETRETVTEIKKSRFIARASHVADRCQAMAFLEQVRSDFPDARHHCWAYLLGNPNAACNAAMNDDGEPAGTAGKPILNVIQHKGIGDVIVVVARYFGGIKLGAGGLTRAYASATESLLSTLKLVQHEPMLQLQLQFEFSREQLVRHWADVNGAKVGAPLYSQRVAMTLLLPARLEAELNAFCLSQGIKCSKVGQGGGRSTPP